MKWIMSLGLVLGMMVLVLVPGALAEDPKNLNEAGVTVILSDALVLDQGIAKSDYWEPFTDIFGDGTIAVVAGVWGLDENGATMPSTMNAKVAFLRPGSTVFEEYWGFYDDAGNPYTGNFNTKRQTGNPPRIACDRRPGVPLRYCVGQEATPWEFDAFTKERWVDPFLFTERLAACQLFELTANGPQPITTVFDSLYGGIDGTQNGHMRWGGDMVFLSNGNLLACPEDRSGSTISGNAAVAAIYDGATGARITPPFVANGNGEAKEIWSNVAAFNGGFMVRNSGVLTTFDNEGNVVLTLEQLALSIVADTGRSDDARICGSIEKPYVYLSGKDLEGEITLTQIDAITGTTVKEVKVTEEFFLDITASSYSTVDCAADDNGNVVVSWSTQFLGVAQPDAMARIFDSNLDPVTPSFFAFTSHNSDLEGDLGYRTAEGNCSMDNERIVIAMNGIIDDQTTGEYTPSESTLVTVLKNPFYVAVDEWELY